MIYSGRSTIEKINYRLKSYMDTWGKHGYRTEYTLNKVYEVIPDEFIKDGKIIKPEKVFKAVGQELEKLEKSIPTVQDIYLNIQRKKPTEERESMKEWKKSVAENESIRQSITNSLDKLYKYKGGRKIAINKSAQNIIDVLRESHKSKDAIQWASEKIDAIQHKKRVMPYKGIKQKDMLAGF